MSKSYHVIARPDGIWSVKKTGAKRMSGNYPTKREAVATAKRLVTSGGGGELVVHTIDGRVTSRDSLPANGARANGREPVGS